MSRKADCYDNAPMESFLHTLKTELLHHRDYKTRAEAQRDIFGFIEGLQPNKAPFRIRIYRSGRDGAKSRLNPSTFSGEDHFLLKIFADGRKEREPIVKFPRKKRPRSKVDWSRKYSSGLKRGF